MHKHLNIHANACAVVCVITYVRVYTNLYTLQKCNEITLKELGVVQGAMLGKQFKQAWDLKGWFLNLSRYTFIIRIVD